jgi:hypothetical protein
VKRGDRILRPARRQQGRSEIGLGVGIVGVDFDGLFVAGDRCFGATGHLQGDAEAVVQCGDLGCRRAGVAVGFDGVLDLAPVEPVVGQSAHGVDMVRVDRKRAIEGAEGVLRFAEDEACRTQGGPAIGRTGLDREASLIGFGRFFGHIRFGERIAEIDPGFGMLGIGGNGPAIGADGRFMLAQPAVGDAQAGQEGRALASRGDCAAQQGECVLRPAVLGQDDTQQMQRVGIGGRARQNVAIDRFRPVQFSGLMKGDGRRQRRGGGVGGHGAMVDARSALLLAFGRDPAFVSIHAATSMTTGLSDGASRSSRPSRRMS